MLIIPTFAKEKRHGPCNLWSACYLEDIDEDGNPIDIFSLLFDRWNDISFLLAFFKENEQDLATPFWKDISIHEAVHQVMDEAFAFEEELRSIELQKPGYENGSLQQIFQQLHKHEFALKPQFSRFRKGKPDFRAAMLRLYAIELEEGCFVITGGAIKLTEKMNRPHLEAQNRRLILVQDFLNSHGIYSREGLI